MLIVANRYANSIFELAAKLKIEDKVLKELEYFINLLNENKEIKEIWLSKTLSFSEKYQLLIDKLPFQDITKQFLKIVSLRKREKILDFILYYYKKNYEKKNNIIECKLVVSQEINNSILKELLGTIESKINKKIVIKKIEEDPEIIGGFILISEDTILDASIKNSLDKTLKDLTNNIDNYLSNLIKLDV